MSEAGKAGVLGLINHLVAWAREELAGQQELLAVLKEQSLAVRERRPDRLEEVNVRVDACLEQASQRSARRERIFGRLGAHWGVAPRTLTLSSILLRAGEGTGALGELRDELKEVSQKVQVMGRKVHSLLRLHHRITTEVLGGILGEESDGSPGRRGALVDAEG